MENTVDDHPEIRAVRDTWDDAVRDGAPACGHPVAATAYTAMQRALYAELTAHLDTP